MHFIGEQILSGRKGRSYRWEDVNYKEMDVEDQGRYTNLGSLIKMNGTHLLNKCVQCGGENI